MERARLSPEIKMIGQHKPRRGKDEEEGTSTHVADGKALSCGLPYGLGGGELVQPGGFKEGNVGRDI